MIIFLKKWKPDFGLKCGQDLTSFVTALAWERLNLATVGVVPRAETETSSHKVRAFFSKCF